MKYLHAATYSFLWKGRLPDCFFGVRDTDIEAVSKTYASLIDRHKVSADTTDGGLSFPEPALTGRARLVKMFMRMLEPTAANMHQLQGGLWHSYSRLWMLEAVGAGRNDTLGAVIDHKRWTGALKRAKKKQVPARWLAYARSWKLLQPFVRIKPPQTMEEVQSMAIYGGIPTKGDSPLQRTASLKLDDEAACTIGDVWDAKRGEWRRSLTTADQQALTTAVPTRWIDIMKNGSSTPRRGNWILTPTTITPTAQPFHSATGAPHHELGVLYRLQSDARAGIYHMVEYLLGCLKKWIPVREVHVPMPTEYRLATVEPYRITEGEWPPNITLVGPTDKAWAASRGRLTWADNQSYSRWGGHFVVQATLEDIRARWTHARGGRGARPTANVTALIRAVEPHPSATLTRAHRLLKQAAWLAPVKDFARECIGGFLPNGYALGQGHNMCPICGREKFSVYHEIAECRGMRHVREWLLEVSSHLFPILVESAIASFVLFGLHAHFHCNHVAQNLRECVFAQWRAVRARALKHPTNPSRKVVRSTLNARLERAILKDYVHHVDNSLVARWRPYLTIGDDTPTINGLPSPSRPAVTTNPTP